MHPAPPIGIVVVNWNGLNRTRTCIRSLLALNYNAVRIAVIDNGSIDGSADALSAEFSQVEVLSLPENRGYAAACNEGIRWARREGLRYVWLLNNDTVIAPDAASALIDAAYLIGTPAILAPEILRSDGTVWSAGGVLRWPWLERDHIGMGNTARSYPRRREIAWASGCSLMFPLDVVDTAGELDERFFLYLEDVDWCLTAREHGIPTWYVPGARIWHAVSESTHTLDPRILRYYESRNYFLFAFRHAGMIGRAWAAGRMLITLAKIAARSVIDPESRHDSLYHAQTRGLLDVLRRRFGPAPYPHVPITMAPRPVDGAAVPA